MAASKRVEFSTFDGTVLRGNFFLPEKQNAPAIIMISGLTFLKDHVIDIPNRFQQAGYAVLVYDHRSWGSSDGTPRQHIDLTQQGDDLSDAVTWISSQASAVDPSRIALWGVGHGGGVVMAPGATDPRVKALAIWMPFISGQWDSKAWPKGHEQLLWQDRAARASGKTTSDEPTYIPIFPESLEAAKKDPRGTLIGIPQIVPFHEGAKAASDAAGTPWDNKVTLQSLFYQRRWNPTTFLPQLTIPALYITAENDEFTPHAMHMQAYEQIGGPKELLVLKSENLEALATDGTRGQAVEKTVTFLNKHI